MDGYNFLLDAAVIFYGLRALCIWFRMQQAKTIVDSRLICPRDLTAADCSDAAACYGFLNKKFLIFGIFSPIFGLLNILCTLRLLPFSHILFTVSTAAIVLSILFFCYTISRSAKQYW